MGHPSVRYRERSQLFGGVWLDLGDCPDRIAYLEAGEAAYAEVLAQLADLLRNQVLDGKRLILDKGLIEQANFFIKLAHLAFNDLIDYLGRLTRGRSLGAVDVLLPLQILGGDVLAANIARISGRDMHRDVLQQLLKILRPGNKVALAVDFDQHTDLAAGMNVGADSPFGSATRCLLRSRRHALLTQNNDRLVQITLGFLKRVAAIHHR